MSQIEDSIDRLSTQRQFIKDDNFPIKGITSELYATKPRESILSMGRPPGRKECIILKEWINNKLSQLDQNANDYLQSFRLMNEFCLLELIRQCSVNCLEQGDLLKYLISNIKDHNDRYAYNKGS